MEEIQDKQEVLIARDNDTGKVGAVVGQNPDGTPKMADVKSSKLSDLVKFRKGENPLESFLSNFMRQVKNPTSFSLFKLSADEYDKLGVPMADMLNDPETNKAMLEKYRVDTKAQSQNQEQSNGVKHPPIDPEKIDWNSIEKEWGIKRETIEQSGAFNQMLYNKKSNMLFDLKATLGGEETEGKAKLSFRTNPDGSYTLTPHFVQKEPKLDQTYNGYTFTEEDKANLKQTGNLGKVVDLTDPHTGQTQKCLVSLDKITNEIESIPVDKVYIKNKVANIDLTMKQIGYLKTGGLIKEQHIELPNGRKFTADLQYNAGKREIAFVNSDLYQKHEQTQREGQKEGQEALKQKSPNWTDENGNPKRLTQWYKIPLDEQKQADYLAGKQVLVGETKDKKGNDCTIYLQFDPREKKPQTTREYPDREKVVGIAEENKTQVSVNNQGKTNEATKNIKEPLQKGQTAPKDENQQKEQKKSKGQKL